MRGNSIAAVSCLATCCFFAFCITSCGGGSSPTMANPSGAPSPASGNTSPAGPSKAKIAGIAFVGSSVTAAGHYAPLPAGTKIYPSGSTISGTTGCPTNRYGTDGMIVVVIDYQGRPTAGSLTLIRHPATGGNFTDAPYMMDINPGRYLQTIGPYTNNGSYEIQLTYDYSLGPGQKDSASYTLTRNCPPVN
jgi:hypothetical protein